SCRAPGPPVCDRCRAGLQLLTGPCCGRCGRPAERPVERCRECRGRRLRFASATAAVALQGPAHALVRAWKDRGLRAAADVAAELAVAVVAPPGHDVVLVPVPAHAARAAWRGGDGARALAERLGAAWEREVVLPLRRTGARPQRGLDRDARRRNAHAQFR